MAEKQQKEAAAPKARRAKKADPAEAQTDPGTGNLKVNMVGVVNTENQKVRDVGLSPEVFGVKVNRHLIYEAVKAFRAGGRAGTHATKNRANVSGSGKKPWKQKGTGRARVGETRNPLWRHGGTVFGPQPRDYSFSMPKKARAAALRSALSQRVKEGALRIVDSFPIEKPANPPYRLSHQLRGILDKLGVEGKAVIVDHEPTDALVLSGRNLDGVKVVDTTHLNVYDVLDCKTILVSAEALNKLEERLTP